MYLRAAVLVGLLFGVSYCAYGQSSRVFEWKGDNGSADSLRIFEEPCTEPAVTKALVAQVPAEYHGKFKRSVLVWAGVVYQSCWIETPRLEVLNLDEKGDFLQPSIPTSLFKDKSI
jgi:hypothetical protein